MKRIKSILCTCLILFLVLFVSACSKNYDSITYKRFVEKMGSELNYVITDNTVTYDGIYKRCYTAIKDDVIVSFYEFEDEKEAKDYVKKNYDDKKYYSYKAYDDYSTVKYSEVGYFRLIQVGNVVVSGSSEKSSSKSIINDALKELGY